jgi:hypothetical protein
MSDNQFGNRQGTHIRRRAANNSSAPSADSGVDSHPLLQLQRQLGNNHVARMIAQREGVPEEEELLQAKHDTSIQREGVPEEEEMLQAKHDASIQREGVPEEEEMLQAKHDASIQRHGSEEDTLQAKHDTSIQREGAPDEEELLQAKHDTSIQREGAPDEEELLQAKHDTSIQRHGSEEDTLQASPEVGLEGGPVSSSISDQINAKRGSGSTLDSSVQSSMESSFGTSFEGVRVHSDSESAQLNRSISAKAFTTGNDIFLGQGASQSDSSLMAHELTHVVQQRSMSASGPMSVGPAGDSYEQQADAVASAVTSGAAAPAQRSTDESAA